MHVGLVWTGKRSWPTTELADQVEVVLIPLHCHLPSVDEAQPAECGDW